MGYTIFSKHFSFIRTTLHYAAFLLAFLFFIIVTYSCKKEPSVGPPDPPIDIIKNTINLSVEWTDLYRIKIKWNKAEDDTLNNYLYNLIRKDEKGNEITRTFYITGNDTSYVDDNDGDSLGTGKLYSYRIKAYNKEDELKDTSKTITAATLSPTSHNIEWKVDTLGQPGNSLYDVWGLDENNVFAVGYVQMPEGPTGIIKWDGQKWNSFPASGGVKYGIFGFGLNNIFVVGESINRGFAAIYDGKIWREFNDDYFLSNADTVYPLRSVWGSSPDDVWAVGSQGTIIHWNGSEWKKVQSPTQMYLIDIWGNAPDNIYAVGATLTNQYELLHYNGIGWKLISDQIPFGLWMFRSIWIDKSGKGVIVGNKGFFYDGKNWNLIPDNRFVRLQRVRGSGMNNIFAGGQYGNLLHYNGIHWDKFEELEDLNNFCTMQGIAVFENSVIIGGYNFNGVLIWHGRIK